MIYYHTQRPSFPFSFQLLNSMRYTKQSRNNAKLCSISYPDNTLQCLLAYKKPPSHLLDAYAAKIKNLTLFVDLHLCCHYENETHQSMCVKLFQVLMQRNNFH